jgi:hypothetical protein
MAAGPSQQPAGAAGGDGGGEGEGTRLLRFTTVMEPPPDLGLSAGWGLAGQLSSWAALPELRCTRDGEERITLGVLMQHRSLP